MHLKEYIIQNSIFAKKKTVFLLVCKYLNYLIYLDANFTLNKFATLIEKNRAFFAIIYFKKIMLKYRK